MPVSPDSWLNILERSDLRTLWATDRTQTLHRYLEASVLAFADRGAYVGAPGEMQPGVLRQLLSQPFADERACAIDPARPPRPGRGPPARPTGPTTGTATVPPSRRAPSPTVRACPPRT